ncbi:hypothetical protein S101189_01174 [Pediococcus acidilactici]|uniref:hypothetical protein n=1 Tax=Pediococcus acidilactici TaxID=1254 RepID=UPI0007EF43D2|nr:hypothetical protein [Pediococcus acidilactici]ARW24610.1 hypothetical protein S100424_01174 [Pediococcus acidilactici]ARW26652.1 hypothetical protein S100313_01217 [Pediococcus acidilactici]ARW28728.1 hypothetical protein S101189_01174 [Pediococcus acidilactici]OBR30925.1 hypothetical protein SRCM100320_00418 [Pediococcus acidilactici]WDA27217.1 hypothetical protein PSQ91_05795 [Pediococcus acidilactici]
MPDVWKWKEALAKAHLKQEEAGNVVNISKNQMSILVKRMILGKGLLASDLDKKRWKLILEYIKFKQEELGDSEKVIT